MRKTLLATVAMLGLTVSGAMAQSGNSAYIEQTAPYGATAGATAYQEQSGTTNTATVVQTNSPLSSAYQLQVGTSNIATTTQNQGTSNTAQTEQRGTGHRSTITQDGGSGSTTTHYQNGNSGSGHTADSYMIGQTNGRQIVRQDAPDGVGSAATQRMLAAGSNNVQTIIQGRGANTATQVLR